MSAFPAVTVALAALLLLPADRGLAESSGGGGAASEAVRLASREATRRDQQIRNAQEILTGAELDRREGNYADAVEKYRTAYLSLPNIPAAKSLKESIFKRYQQASVEYAEELITEAKWEEAESVLVQVMTDARENGMMPSSVNPQVRTLLTRLRGDYYNKAMSPEHLANVDTVEALLQKAKGYVDIGDLTKARRSYQAVLSIDGYNSAARRGLEMVDQLIMEYAEVARNQTRAEMLREVAGAWESEVPPLAEPSGIEVSVEPVGVREAAVKEKLEQLVLPNVEFVNTPLQAVLEYLTQIATELDATEPDPSERGVNIVVDPQSTTQGPQIMQKPITLQLSNAPLSAVLGYVAQQAGLKYRIDEFAVTLVPLSSSDDQALITRTYLVPPDFISGQAAQGGGGGGGAVDPFAQPAANTGTGSVVKRVSAQEFLENSGVTFPPGSIANFNPVSSMLLIRNTPDNVSLVESMIQGAREGGSKLVQVDLKMIETTEEILNELGFDWLLGQANVPGSGDIFLGGGTLGYEAGSRTAADFPFAYPGSGTPLGENPVTAGLRTGNIQSRLSIDDVINRDSPTAVGGAGAAPGVFSIAGAFTDPTFQVVLRTLAQTKGVDFVSTASVVTRPGERAVIKQVREFIYPTEYDPPEIPNQFGGGGVSFPVTPATPAAFETRELGKILEVEPTVGDDNLTVNLNLTTDVSDFSGFINYGSPITTGGGDTTVVGNVFTTTAANVLTENQILMPVFDAIKENTIVTIYDGQTIAIGGLTGETITKAQDKVPVLGDAPLMGRLFRSEVEDRFRRALVVFATVRILEPGGRPLNDLALRQTGQAE